MSDGDDTMSARTWVRRSLSVGRSPLDEEAVRRGEVGELSLAPFQRRAVERGLSIARRYGGVLLADAVGLGKTRVSLGLAEGLARDARLRSGRSREVLLCVPARLREQWRRSTQKGRISPVRVVSHTELSRRSVDVESLEPGVIVVDEAHRFRNPDAQRSRQLAALAARAPVVLATATPVCNSLWDLYHLFALFLADDDLRPVVGHDLEAAFEAAERGELDPTELVEQLAVRRTQAPSDEGFGERPSARLEMLRYEPGPDERWIWEHLEPRLRDLSFEACADQWPKPLFVEYALRRWESGPDALAETLESLIAYHRRWLEARSHGRTLSRDDFSELFETGDGGHQEVFPFLFPDDASESPDDVSGTEDAESVRRDIEDLEKLLGRIESVMEGRTGLVRAVVEQARTLEDKLLIFTKYRRAAEGLFDALCESFGGSARIGLTTGGEARATGLGRTSSVELIRRFAPEAQGLEPPPFHQQIRVLVSTDCLSRGVNLQDCGHLVLADLPYSPLVVEQRVGRLLRPGGPHDTVRVYVPRPDDWNDTLGLRRRIRRKLSHARRSGAAPTATNALDWTDDGEAEGFEMAREDLAVPEDEEPSSDASTRRGEADAIVGRSVAPRPGPEQMARPTEHDEPLAALTRLDALARRLDAHAADPVEGYWRAEAPVFEPALWTRAVFESSQETRVRWALLHDDGVEWRTSRLVRGLSALADARLDLRRREPPDDWLEKAEAAIEAYCRRLEAARLAPSPLSLDAPQHLWWRRICEWVEAGTLDLEDERLASLRRRLLRSLPRGVEHQLRELLESEPPPEVALRRLDRLLQRHPVRTGSISAHLVSGLHLLPTSRE